MASSVELRGTAWLGVAGILLGVGLTVWGLLRSRRKLLPVFAVGAVFLVLAISSVTMSGSFLVVLPIVLGELVVGLLLGVLAPSDRTASLLCVGGCLLVFFLGLVVFSPQGEQWSGDMFALTTEAVVASAVWLMVAAGAALGSVVREARSQPVESH